MNGQIFWQRPQSKIPEHRRGFDATASVVSHRKFIKIVWDNLHQLSSLTTLCLLFQVSGVRCQDNEAVEAQIIWLRILSSFC
jgi:hypothetical protein